MWQMCTFSGLTAAPRSTALMLAPVWEPRSRIRVVGVSSKLRRNSSPRLLRADCEMARIARESGSRAYAKDCIFERLGAVDPAGCIVRGDGHYPRDARPCISASLLPASCQSARCQPPTSRGVDPISPLFLRFASGQRGNPDRDQADDAHYQ